MPAPSSCPPAGPPGLWHSSDNRTKHPRRVLIHLDPFYLDWSLSRIPHQSICPLQASACHDSQGDRAPVLDSPQFWMHTVSMILSALPVPLLYIGTDNDSSALTPAHPACCVIYPLPPFERQTIVPSCSGASHPGLSMPEVQGQCFSHPCPPPLELPGFVGQFWNLVSQECYLGLSILVRASVTARRQLGMPLLPVVFSPLALHC